MAWAVEPLKNENMANWQIEPARVAEQTVLDDDTGQVYRAPVTFDEQDIRFAIATQANKEPKRDFIGKVKYAAGEAWNWAEKFANRVESGFQSAERGVIGLGGQALDTFLHASLSVPARVEQIEKYKSGDFSDWDAGLNGRVTDEDIAKEDDPALQAAMQFRKDRQDALIAKAEERLEQRQRIRRKLEASIRKWQEILRPEAEMDGYDRFMEAMGSGTASLALSVATLAATKNPQVAAGIMAGTFGRMRYTDVFDKSIEKGLDYATADDYATIAGTIEGGIELALEPFLYGVANLRPVRKITDEMIGGAVARLNATAAGKSAARKIVSKHRQSVGRQSLKAAAIEGSEEALQEAGGAYFENYTGLENTPQEEIMARTLLSFAVGGLTGAGAAVMGTSAYNREAAATNERIKKSLTEAYPELTAEENQKTADALQEIFYQDGEGRMLNELELLADKENDPDTLESGKHEISEDMHSILKKRYQMSDEEIDRTAEIAVASIDLRNQFNEAQTAFYDGLVNADVKPNVAEPFSRLMAARASAVAMNEKKTVKDVLERWNLKFERRAQPVNLTELLDDEIPYQSGASNADDMAQNDNILYQGALQEALDIAEKISRIDAERLAFERKDINSELKGRENEKVKAVEINRFFADRKTSKDISIDEVRAVVDANVGKNENGVRVLKNSVTGETATLSNKAVEKMFNTTSDRADNQNIGGILGKECIANIGRIFDTALLIKNTPDAKHGTKNRIRRYANAIVSDGEMFVVKITVKEMANKRLELTDIEIENNGGTDLAAYDLKVGRKNTATGNISTDKSVASLSGNNISIDDLIEFVNTYTAETIQIDGKEKAVRNSAGERIARTEEGLRAFYEWFGDSKAVDENGRPLMVYHGTGADFDTFDVSKSGKNTGNKGFYGDGIYLTDKDSEAKFYAQQSVIDRFSSRIFGNMSYDKAQQFIKDKSIIMPLYVSLKNPFMWNGITTEEEAKAISRKIGMKLEWNEKYKQINHFRDDKKSVKFSEKLKQAGYDGVIYKGDNGREIVVFNPNQIKSVYNRGTWDARNDNIYYQTVRAKKTDVSTQTDPKQIRVDAKKYLLDIVRKQNIKHPVLGKIRVSKKGINELINSSGNLDKLALVPHLKELIETSAVGERENLTHQRKDSIVAFYPLYNDAVIDGKPYDVTTKIGVDENGNLFYTVLLDEKTSFQDSNKETKSKPAKEAINLSITPKEENVNSSLRQRAPKDARGAYDAAKRLITLFEGADPSTLIHEAAHFFLDDMRRFADNQTTAEELQAIYRYVGSTDGVLTKEQNEYFARSFEAYLMEGKAPNSLLKRVFEKFRKWLRTIYSQIKNLNVKLDDNIRKTFDEMLGGRKLDFAMQLSRERLAENIKAGNIGQTAINKAMRLLEEGKMSKADMDEMVGRLEDGRLKRSDVKKYLEPFEKSANRHHEAVYDWDYQYYRRRLEQGNVTPAIVRKRIDRLLEWSKPRTQNGKVVGRFPDIKVNRFFDAVRENINLKRDEALARIDANLRQLEEITQKGMSGEDGNFRNVSDIIWENKVLAIPAGRASVGLMADVYNDIAEIYNTGRLSERVTGMVKRAWRERLIGEAVAVLEQGKGRNWRRESSDLTKRMRRFGLSMFSWNGILDVLSMFDKGSKSGESALSRNLTVFQEEKKMRIGVYEDGETVSRLMAGALQSAENGGISVNRYINKVLPEKFTIEWGSNAKRFSKDQLLDIYMKAKDPETREIMVNDDILQFNEEFFARVDEHLSEQDKAVAEALFQFYEETYDKLNRFYEEHYGISLGHRPYYSPRTMDKGGIDVVSGDLRSYAGLSAIKKRTAKGGQIKIKGAFNVLQNYINNANHFIAFADKLQDINAVLGDPEVKNRIRNVFGEKMNEKIAYEISRFASNDKVYVQGVNGIMSKLRANYAVSVLGLKPSLAIKQLTSFPAYWENVPTKDFLEGLADFARHPKQAIETLSHSQYMKTRGTNIIKDFEEVSKSEMLKNLGTKIGLREFLMLNIQLGDRGSIYMGGWPLYKYMLKKTGDPAKAMAEFERITNETQQSSYMSEQSAWQSNPFGNWFTMFQSSQNQYLRKELTALRGLATGRMDWDKAMKTLFIYHFLLPMFFQFVSDGFRWDKDAQLRAAALGSLNGAFVLGKVMERMVDWAITGTLNYKLGIRELLPPVSVLENGAKFAYDSWKYYRDDISLEDYMEALQGGIRTAGEATGLPLKYPMDVAKANGDYLDEGEYGKAALLWLGWSPYALRDLEE